MLDAAAARAADAGADAVRFALAPMDRLPVGTATASLVIAHGIWNLATSDDQFRAAVHESARIAQDDARLFLFTFSRATLPPGATPVAGERLIYTEFSGNKQVFLTENQIYTELQSAGFVPDPLLPLRELNRDNRPRLAGTGAPVIWEGVFRRVRTA
jgi:ubiquinone/menaquinone biosynthesis C-methylase UbiE